MKKFLAIFFNIIAAFCAVATLTFINIEFPDGNTVSVISSPVYEKSEDFYTLVNKNVTDIFNYIGYKKAFETNGDLNYDSYVARSRNSRGNTWVWKLQDCIDIAKAHGLFIDTDYNIKIANDYEYPKFDKNEFFSFDHKSYPSNTATSTISEEEFIVEVMQALATYNRCKMASTNNSNFRYILSFYDRVNKKTTEYRNTDMKPNDFLSNNAFIYISQKDNIISSNIDLVSNSLTKNINNVNPYPEMEYTFYCSIDTTYKCNDAFKLEHSTYSAKKSRCGTLIVLAIASLIVFLATLFIAFYQIFVSEIKVEESQMFFFAMPTELHIAFYIIINLSLFQVLEFIYAKNTTVQHSGIKAYFYIFLIYATTIVFLAILSTKYSDGTLTPSLLKLNQDMSNNSKTKVSPMLSFVLVFLPIVIFIMLSFYLFYLYTTLSQKILLIFGIILLLSTIGFIIYLFTLYNAFNKTLKAQANANNMKSTLITNVTHDIKTPLTSIMSYADLITEEIKNPSKSQKKNLMHYSKIVNEKTNRLNDLINDLIFDSKVSTGNIKLNFEKLDLVEFLSQINNEFNDKFKACKLKVVFEHNDDTAFIKADSNQLYRVFQNLYSNICKYSLPNSRVYIDITKVKHKVKVNIKNIQKEKLDVDVKTLKEKFVRGSESRSTEGFGLGLSIAENLIKSMGGKLNINSIKDEFITEITFLLHEN